MRDARDIETVRIDKVRDLPMRLTCPRCGAQYEIAAAAIPVAGREVECSACSNVWFQPGQPKAATPYDPEARPSLNRPLNESILAILRDETARELQARQSDAGKPAPGSDQNIAKTEAETAPAVTRAEPEPTTAPAIEPVAELSAEPVADPITVASANTPAMADADWPATTLTTAPPEFASPESILPLVDLPEPAPAPAEAVTAPAMPANAVDMMPEPAPFEAPASTLAPPAPEDDTRPEPVVAALPDAAELAATLTRPGPPPALPPVLQPVNTQTKPAPAAPVTDRTPEPAVSAPLPAVAAAKRGPGYASGFGLAAMLALGVVAVYALAPRVAADEDGGLLAEWRQDIDRGRLWLHDRIIGE